MARGHIGGSRRLQFDPSAFLQGDGGNKGDTAMEMAMRLMGYGGRASPEELGLSREKLLADIAGQTGTQDIERQKLEELRRSNLSAEEFQKFQKEQLLKNAADELKYKQDVLGLDREKAEMSLASDIIKDVSTTAEQKQAIFRQFSPRAQQMLQAQAEQAQRKQALDLLPKLQAVYAKGAPQGELKTLLAGYGEDVLRRPEIPWEPLNQSLVAAKQEAAGKPFAGALSAPWQEYQGAPNLEQVFVPPPAPKGTEEIAPWLRPEASALGAMDWRYGGGGGGPSVDPAQYSQYAPGAAFSRQGLPNLPPDVPGTQEPGMLDRILATLGLK
jgi:hypothetical protein